MINYVDYYADEEYYDDNNDNYYDDKEVYHNEGYDEIYEAIRENTDNRRKPYTPKRPSRPRRNGQGNPIMQQAQTQIFPQTNETSKQQPIQDVTMKGNNIRRKRGPNRFDQEEGYDIVEDITKQRANISFGQIIKESPSQATRFRKAFVRPVMQDE